MPNMNSPMALQYLLGDLGSRRALAMALRAREGDGGGGEMVSGRYVPNLRAAGGAIARGLFGDPLEKLRQEEHGALSAYNDELSGAMEGMLGAENVTDDAEFARRAARAQSAGVPQDYIRPVLERRQGWQMLNQMLSGLQDAPAQGVAAGGGAPVGSVRGAPPAGGPALPPAGGAAPGGDVPEGAPGGGNPAVAAAFAPAGGGTPLSGVPDGKLITFAAIAPKGTPAANLAAAELEARKVSVKDGVVYRMNRAIGKIDGGYFYDLQTGEAHDLTGKMEAQRAGGKAAAEEAARFPYRTIETKQGDQTRTVFAKDLPGAPGGAPAPAPQATTGGGGGFKFSFEGSPEDARKALDASMRDFQSRPAATSGAGGAGGFPLGTSMGDVEKKAREASIDTGAKAQQGVNDDFLKGSYRPTLDAGASATSTIGQLDALEKLALKTGWGSGVQTSAARILNGLGIAPKDAQQYAAKAETFYSIVGQQNWQLLSEQKGPQTEGDANRAAKVFAQITNTEQANKFITDLARANALVRVEKAKFYRAALPEAQKSGDLSRIEAAWSERQPSIFSFPFMQKWGQTDTSTTAPAAPGGRDSKIDAYLRQYGSP